VGFLDTVDYAWPETNDIADTGNEGAAICGATSRGGRHSHPLLDRGGGDQLLIASETGKGSLHGLLTKATRSVEAFPEPGDDLVAFGVMYPITVRSGYDIG
jgi:hypothetical protein